MESDSTAVSLGNMVLPSGSLVSQGYFRSRLFMLPSTTNPLVAAAGPLLSVLERLSVSKTLPAIEQICHNVEHELNAFHSRLMRQTYANEFIVIARYLLCATIDELVGKSYVRIYGQAASFKAFTPSSQEDVGPQYRFFEIVRYLKERVIQYLDLLELAYYCLIAGFEGEYHVRSDGRQCLDDLLEELYRLIEQHRAYKPHQLFKPDSRLLPLPQVYKPVLKHALMLLSLIVGLYCGSHLLLEQKAKTLLWSHYSGLMSGAVE